MIRIWFSTILIGVLLLFSASVFGQRQTMFVFPQVTDSEINLSLTRHYVARNLSVAQRNQLMIFFPGTGGSPVAYETFTDLAADMGFHSIGLSYVNNNAVNQLCANQGDLDCYGNVRLEGLDGTERSSLIDVNRPNSIENRIIKLLIYLENQFPSENWEQYLDKNNQIKWDKVVVAGHSQGGGVAGIIAKNHRVARSVMFAATDFNSSLNSLANWINAPGVSPSSVYFGFTHRQDELVNYLVLSNLTWNAYGMNGFGPIVNVEDTTTPFNNSHSLNSNDPELPNGGTYHSAIVVDSRFPVDENGVSVHEPVWRYLLNTSTLSLTNIEFLRFGKPVSRPSIGRSTKYFQLILQGSGFDSATKVFIDDNEVDAEPISSDEIRAKLPAGKIRSVGSSTIKTRNQSGEDSNILTF